LPIARAELVKVYRTAIGLLLATRAIQSPSDRQCPPAHTRRPVLCCKVPCPIGSDRLPGAYTANDMPLSGFASRKTSMRSPPLPTLYHTLAPAASVRVAPSACNAFAGLSPLRAGTTGAGAKFAGGRIDDPDEGGETTLSGTGTGVAGTMTAPSVNRSPSCRIRGVGHGVAVLQGSPQLQGHGGSAARATVDIPRTIIRARTMIDAD